MVRLKIQRIETRPYLTNCGIKLETKSWRGQSFTQESMSLGGKKLDYTREYEPGREVTGLHKRYSMEGKKVNKQKEQRIGPEVKDHNFPLVANCHYLTIDLKNQ